MNVLITGGGSGLGKALAQKYLKLGHSVLFTDINQAQGQAAYQELKTLGDVHFEVANATSDEDWGKLTQWVTNHWGHIDVLINNAGVAAAGRIDKISMADWDWILDINLKGVIRGCHAFVPMMKQKGNGQIINIASLAAVANAPTMSSYNVTKAGVVSLSETLRHELSPYGLRVSVVCPNFFQTNLADNLRTPEAGMESTVRKLLASGKLSAEQVAEKVIRGAKKNQFMILPHIEGKALFLIKRYVPFLYNIGLSDAGRKLKRKLESQPK